jgi:hypothetical protein
MRNPKQNTPKGGAQPRMTNETDWKSAHISEAEYLGQAPRPDGGLDGSAEAYQPNQGDRGVSAIHLEALYTLHTH